MFCSERTGNPHLYAIDATLHGPPTPLTSGHFMDAAPAFTPDGQSLLFVSDREGNADLFEMPFRPGDPRAGNAVVNLTRNPAGDFRPAVSPDGRTVAFSSDRDHRGVYPFLSEVYVMNRDGSGPRRLTWTNAVNGSPAWSRDGRTLYFYSNRDGDRKSFRIWAMDPDGSNERALTPKELSALSPAVMPDGRIAFAVKKPEGFQISSSAADGSDLRLESGALRDCRGPAFDRQSRRMVCAGRGSASERKLPLAAPGAHEEVRLPDRLVELVALSSLFCSISPDGLEVLTSRSATPGELKDSHLVVSRFDGSREREVFRPPNGEPVWATSWARAADRIAFAVGQPFGPDDAVVDIWTAHSDGSNATNLTGGRFRNNAFPDLSADGRQIVFRSTRKGNKAIYLMNSDGSETRRVASNPDGGNATMPTISPSGDMVAFSTFQIQLQPLKNGFASGGPRLFQRFSPSVHSRFSPDGKWIAFASRLAWWNDEAPLSDDESQPYGEIFIAPVDGTYEPIRLTHNKWEDSVPCWGVLPAVERSR